MELTKVSDGAIKMTGRILLILCLVGAALLTREPQAQAQSCSFSISNTNFGNVDLTANSTVDTTANLTVSCTGKKSKTVRVCPNINDGSGGSNNMGSPRLLVDGLGDSILYSLYQDTARTVVWGSWVWPYSASYPAPQLDLALGSTGSAVQTYVVYGRISAGQQTVPPGSFTSSFAGAQTLMTWAYDSAGACATQPYVGSAQTPFTVSANNQRNCTVSASPLNFGSIGLLASNVDSTAALRVTCSSTVSYTVALDGGGAGATDPTQRKMKNGSANILYGLYGDAARTQGWLNGAPYYQGSGVGTVPPAMWLEFGVARSPVT